jgi:hypothetical protein
MKSFSLSRGTTHYESPWAEEEIDRRVKHLQTCAKNRKKRKKKRRK